MVITGDFGLTGFSSSTIASSFLVSSESDDPESVLVSVSSFRRDVEGLVNCFLVRFGGSFFFDVDIVLVVGGVVECD